MEVGHPGEHGAHAVNAVMGNRAEHESVTVHLHPGPESTAKMTSLNGGIVLETVMVI